MLTKAGQAKRASEIAGEKEEVELAVINAMSKNNYGNIEEDNLKKSLPKDSDVKKVGKNFLATLKNGNQYRIYSNGDVKYYDFKPMESTAVYGKLDDDGTLFLRATKPDNSYRTYTNSSAITTEWNPTLPATKEAVLKVDIEEPIAPTLASEFFKNCSNIKEIENIKNLHTENIKNMDSMFLGCSKLINLDVSNFNTSNVETVNAMFKNCKKIQNIDVSKFDTQNVTDFYGMFLECNELISIDVSGFNTEKAENMNNMFFNCTSLTKLDLSSFNTLNLTEFKYMFVGVTAAIRLGPNWNSNITASNTGYAGSLWNT